MSVSSMFNAVLDAVLAEPTLTVGVAAILLAFVYELLSVGSSKRRMEELGPAAVSRNYAEAIALLWALCAACLVAWLASGRSVDALGLGAPISAEGALWRVAAGWGLALLGLVFVSSQLLALRTEDGRKALRAQLDASEGYEQVRPQTRRQLGLFQGVAVTAGVTEEIIFRGFLIGVLALALPVWAAAIAAGLLFVAFHAYQGVAGMIRILPITIVLTLIVVLSGSLWPAILLHIAADVVGGVLMWAVRDPSDEDQTPRGAVRYPQA